MMPRMRLLLSKAINNNACHRYGTVDHFIDIRAIISKKSEAQNCIRKTIIKWKHASIACLENAMSRCSMACRSASICILLPLYLFLIAQSYSEDALALISFDCTIGFMILQSWLSSSTSFLLSSISFSCEVFPTSKPFMMQFMMMAKMIGMIMMGAARRTRRCYAVSS
jgi:hypothetical protein